MMEAPFVLYVMEKTELKMEVFVVKGAHNDSSIMLVKENKEKHSWQRC